MMSALLYYKHDNDNRDHDYAIYKYLMAIYCDILG